MKLKILILLNVLFFLNLSFGTTKNKKSKKQKFKIEKVTNKIHMISGGGANVAVLTGDDGIILVDTKLINESKAFKKQLRKINKGKVKFVINTHWHGDHTGGNNNFGKRSLIIAHENVRKKVSFDQFSSFFNRTTKKQPQQGLPIVTFSSDINIYQNNEHIRVIHLPNGHTDGDAIVIFEKAKVVHTGDLFFSGKFPYVDLDHGGNVISYHKNVQELLKIIPKNFKIIPGHGPVSTYEQLQEFEQMIGMSIDRVKDEKNIGTQVDKINLKSVIEKYPGYEQGFINEKSWVKLINQSL